MTKRRPEARRLHGDAGTTIIELLVTMVIMAIASGVISTVLVSAQQVTNDIQNSAAAIDSARLISASLDRELRSASCIAAPGDNMAGNTLSFRSLTGGELRSVTYVVGEGIVTRSEGTGPARVVIEHVGQTTTAFTQVATPLRTVVVDIPIESANGGVFRLRTTVAGRNVWRAC